MRVVWKIHKLNKESIFYRLLNFLLESHRWNWIKRVHALFYFYFVVFFVFCSFLQFSLYVLVCFSIFTEITRTMRKTHQYIQRKLQKWGNYKENLKNRRGRVSYTEWAIFIIFYLCWRLFSKKQEISKFNKIPGASISPTKSKEKNFQTKTKGKSN